MRALIRRKRWLFFKRMMRYHFSRRLAGLLQHHLARPSVQPESQYLETIQNGPNRVKKAALLGPQQEAEGAGYLQLQRPGIPPCISIIEDQQGILYFQSKASTSFSPSPRCVTSGSSVRSRTGRTVSHESSSSVGRSTFRRCPSRSSPTTASGTYTCPASAGRSSSTPAWCRY